MALRQVGMLLGPKAPVQSQHTLSFIQQPQVTDPHSLRPNSLRSQPNRRR